MTPEDKILQRIERESREREAQFREYMRSIGREDVLADYDRNMREIRLGISGARGCWHALSERQRIVLGMLCSGFKLRRSKRKASLYDAHGTTKVIRDVCRLKTLRNLAARELAHVNGGAVDPEAEFIVTERGRFVREHGETS